MITKSIDIANGVKINYIETENFKTNYISFNFITQRREDVSYLNTLFTRIIQHASATYPTVAEMEKRLQYLYASTLSRRSISNGKFHIFGIKSSILNDRYTEDTPVTQEIVNLMCDVLFNPIIENGAFSSKYTQDEKLELIDFIESEINNKGKYASNRCTEIMCENEIFSVKVSGTKEQVEKATPQMIFDAYKKALKEYRIEIYVVGKADVDKIASIFKPHFDKIERDLETIDEIELVNTVKQVKDVEEIQDVAQGKLCMGFRTGRSFEDSNYYVMELFNEIFGASPTSKLFVNVRERKSLCYSCGSYIDHKNGIMRVSAGIEPANKQVAIDAILEQLECMKEGKISDEEFESARKSLRNVYLSVNDSVYSMESWVLNRSLSSNYVTPTEEAERLFSITKEEIAEYARGIQLDTIYFLKGGEANA